MFLPQQFPSCNNDKSVAVSASDAIQRNEKMSQEKHNIMRELMQLESNIKNLNVENSQLKELLESEKSRCRTLHIEKLAAERKTAELIANRTRNEANI